MTRYNVRVTLRLPVDVVARYRLLARRTRIPYTALMRLALLRTLKGIEQGD